MRINFNRDVLLIRNLMKLEITKNFVKNNNGNETPVCIYIDNVTIYKLEHPHTTLLIWDSARKDRLYQLETKYFIDESNNILELYNGVKLNEERCYENNIYLMPLRDEIEIGVSTSPETKDSLTLFVDIGHSLIKLYFRDMSDCAKIHDFISQDGIKRKYMQIGDIFFYKMRRDSAFVILWSVTSPSRIYKIHTDQLDSKKHFSDLTPLYKVERYYDGLATRDSV